MYSGSSGFEGVVDVGLIVLNIFFLQERKRTKKEPVS